MDWNTVYYSKTIGSELTIVLSWKMKERPILSTFDALKHKKTYLLAHFYAGGIFSKASTWHHCSVDTSDWEVYETLRHRCGALHGIHFQGRVRGKNMEVVAFFTLDLSSFYNFFSINHLIFKSLFQVKANILYDERLFQ